MTLAYATMMLSDGRLLERAVDFGWSYFADSPCGLHLLSEDDGTLSGRLTAGVAGTGHGGVVGVKWFKLDFGGVNVACWPPRPLVHAIGSVVWLWNDGKVHALAPNAAVRFRMLLSATSPDQVEARIAARPRIRRQCRLTPTFGIVKADMSPSQAAAVLSRMKTAIAAGTADSGVQLDQPAVGLHHGLFRLDAAEGGGVGLDFTPGSGNAVIDVLRSDRVADRHNVDYLDALTGQPLLNPLQVEGYFAGTRGRNKVNVLPEFWQPYPNGGDQRIPRVFSNPAGCTYLPMIYGDDRSNSVKGFDFQHVGRLGMTVEPACEQWGDRLAQLDRRIAAGEVCLQYTQAFLDALRAQVMARKGQGHGHVGRRECAWVMDLLNTQPDMQARAQHLAVTHALAMMSNRLIFRASPAALPGDPNRELGFSPSAYAPAGRLDPLDDCSPIMEAVLGAFALERVGDHRTSVAIVRRLFVDERTLLPALFLTKRKSFMTLFGAIRKHVAVGRKGGAVYPDPVKDSGASDYFSFTAVALGLWLDPGYENQYRAVACRLPPPTLQALPNPTFGQQAARIKADVFGQEQTGLFLTYAAARP